MEREGKLSERGNGLRDQIEWGMSSGGHLTHFHLQKQWIKEMTHCLKTFPLSKVDAGCQRLMRHSSRKDGTGQSKAPQRRAASRPDREQSQIERAEPNDPAADQKCHQR
jgi:hypothetical protein